MLNNIINFIFKYDDYLVKYMVYVLKLIELLCSTLSEVIDHVLTNVNKLIEIIIEQHVTLYNTIKM